MRKINTLLTCLLIVMVLCHVMTGSFMMLGISYVTFKPLAYFTLFLTVIHAVIGIILTVKSLIKARKGNSYFELNARFWAIRITGVLMIVLLFFHMGMFGAKKYGRFVLNEFTPLRYIATALLVITLLAHIVLGLKPLLTALGVLSEKNRVKSLLVCLAIFFILAFIATTVYFIGWQLI